MRTHYCGDVNRSHLQQTVTLFGWAHRRRDHGGVIFIDMRDREGLVQVVSDPDRKETFAGGDPGGKARPPPPPARPREPMQKALRLRHQAAKAVREYLDDAGFIDVETPVL